MSADNDDLRRKIDEAKRRLPLPDLMSRLGLGEHAKKSARCLWHDDQHPSFSVFEGDDGFWHYKCFVCDSSGDEIALLVKHLGISRREPIKRYLDMAGFPARPSSKSPESPVSPVSEGQALDAKTRRFLESLAVESACACEAGQS